jgi:hypothetical protein
METFPLSDETIERFFLGTSDPAWEQDGPMVALVDHVAVAVAGPGPSPDHALLQLFWGSGATVERAPEATAVRRPAAREPRRRLRLALSSALGTATVLTGVGAAGASGVLPAPVQRVVARAAEVVSPFQLPKPASDRPDSPGGPGVTQIVDGNGGSASSGPSEARRARCPRRPCPPHTRRRFRRVPHP